MIISRLKHLIFIALLVTLILPLQNLSYPPEAAAAPSAASEDPGRSKLLSFVVRDHLTRHHYSMKKIDDQLSKAAFGLYLKQLDSQKRFLLKKDVARLGAFSTRIDDEINSGRIELPGIAAGIMEKRIVQAREMVRDLLARDFDFTVQESLETDPDKLDFVANEQELRERWRKSLKFQVLSRYLDVKEEDEATASEERQQQARQRVLKSYEELFDRLLGETPQAHLDRYLNAVTRAFDPHTGYLPPTQKEDFDISMRGSLEGIGATLKEEDGFIKVVTVVPGSPAARQGQLQAEDIILMVAEGAGEPVDITDTRIRDAVSRIRGKKGTEVRLTVRKPDGRKIIIPIIRDVVQIEETFVKGTSLFDEATGQTFGYIKIPSFYRDFSSTRSGGTGRNSTDDLRAELKKLQAAKVEGMILDLRNNGGGALTDAVAIAGLFIETGPIVQIRGSDGRIQVLADEDPEIAYDGPLVVLVNQFSASASEILAGALQDYDRAVIIGGEHTHGKGTVQAMIDLDRSLIFPNMEKFKPLGAMKVTIQKFYRITGESTQVRGVVPDIILPDPLAHLKSGERHNEYSLPWDSIQPTTFESWLLPVQDIDHLRTQSSARVKTDANFADIIRDAKKARKRAERTLQSLHIDDLRSQREEAKNADKMAAFHGMPMEDEAGNDSADPKRWVKNLQEDPFALEAMAILGDLLALEELHRTAGKSGAAAGTH
jgi:carboxyl-terminal processing protease